MDTQALTPDSHGDAQRAAQHAPLAARAPVALRRSKCLHARLQSSACRACVDTCPTSALKMHARGPVLQGGCTACGRCEAACPTRALAVRGFEVLRALPDVAAGPATLACLRLEDAPQQVTLRIPCLGGISDAHLLALCAATLPHAVRIVDHGACASCDSGGACHPAAATVRRVSDWLREAGLEEAKLPRMLRLAGRAALPQGEDPMQAPGRARRGFLAAFVQPAPAAAVSAGARDALAPRQQALRTLALLARRHGGRVSAGVAQGVEIGEGCRGLRICASTCPTGALLRYRDEQAGTAGVSFDAADCIACGNCAAACPQQALRLRPLADFAAGRRPLTRFAQRECSECASRFQAPEDAAQTRCDRCSKSAALARAAFESLFRQDTRSVGRSAIQEELR